MPDLISMSLDELIDGPDSPQAEVVELCSHMIQIDSQGFGPHDARGEVEMCRYVTEQLDEIEVDVSGGTDAKGFAVLPDGRRITCYGCTPLRLPTDFDFISMFHGVDGRVPMASLVFGTTVIDHILQEA